jgi:hypothetical protein
MLEGLALDVATDHKQLGLVFGTQSVKEMFVQGQHAYNELM